jgi:5'-AMP-activated protein kinase regulatory gamma subunit
MSTAGQGAAADLVAQVRGTMCGLLKRYVVTKAMPQTGKVVILDTELSAKHAFWAIYDHGLNSAIAWDSQQRRFVGMLTYTDFMELLRLLYRRHGGEEQSHDPGTVAAAIAAGLEDHQVKSWQDLRPARPASDNFIFVRPETSMLDCIGILQTQQIHRIPVVDPTNNVVLCTVTYWRILRYLARRMKKKRQFDSLLGCTIAKIGLGLRPVVTVQPDTTVSVVLDLLLEHRISAVPVVDTGGKLINVYARTDVQYMAVTQNYNLDMAVSDALQHREAPVHRCRPEVDTLAAVVDVMATGVIRRVICTDEHDMVTGIVSLSDIFRFITDRTERPPRSGWEPEPASFVLPSQ